MGDSSNTFYKLPNWKMNRYLDAVQKNANRVMSRPDIRAFGVAYKMVNNRVTDEVVLTVFVDKNKKDRRSPISSVVRQIPLPCDIVELDFSHEEQAAYGPIPAARRRKRLETIVGGVGIRNPKLGLGHLGALGAVVFDKKTGKPMGLSAAHCLGTEKDAPIVQPPGRYDNGNYVRENEIGRLYKANEHFDAALFWLNERRKFAPKMLGLNGTSDEFQLEEPIRAAIGMQVECAGFRTYVKGRVIGYMLWKEIKKSGRKRTQSVVRRVFIQFLSGGPTNSGDSGAVWVESKSKRPVCLHKGLRGAFAWGSCTLTLAKWGRFKFTESLDDHLVRQLGSHQVGFVRKGTGFLAFCSKPDQNKRLMIRQFDRNLKTIAQKENDEFPFSGVAPCRWRGPNKTVKEYACWQSAGGQDLAGKNEVCDPTGQIESNHGFKWRLL